jgi:Domain of unknown function (DUF5916)/Carbohydrate family 9 binding domain-like
MKMTFKTKKRKENNMNYWRRYTLALILLLSSSAGWANKNNVIEVPNLQGEVVLDGVLDEALWQQAKQVELDIETRPADNIPAKIKTTAFIADNGREILIAFRAQDNQPDTIRAFLRDRDSLWNDDFVGINIDTFNDQRRAFEFYVNPLGAQADLIYEEANGNEDDSWDGLWDSAAKINALGYIVEMRIPYSTLRFPKNTGTAQTWAADFVRFRPRENRYRYSNNVFARGVNCYLCEISKLRGFANANPGKDLEVTPTFTAGKAQSRSGPNAAWQSDGGQYDLGVDVKWGIGSNLTLNGTINPDFSQVETDNAQLDLNTTFALFFPEKRPFFLEGADYFSTPFNVVYTRSVADPDYGVRATGRNDKHTYGFFAAQDAAAQILIPGALSSRFRSLGNDSLAAAGRYRYDFDGQASIGLITTLRDGDDYKNSVFGIDGRWQKNSHTLTTQFLHSRSENPASFGLPAEQSGNAMTLQYNFNNRNWGAYSSHTRFGKNFRADLGFINQVDFNKSVIGGSRQWYGADGAKITQMRVNGDWDITHREDGQLLERELEAYFSLNGPRQSFMQLGAVKRDRFWEGIIFDEAWWSLYGEVTPNSRLQLELFIRQGEQIDFQNARLADVVEVSPGLNLNIGKGINFNIDHTYQKLSRDSGNVFVANLTDARLSWQLNTRQRFRLSLQYGNTVRDLFLCRTPCNADSEERELSAQLLYSYKINPRTAFYAGYSEGQFSDDQFTELFANNRALFMKFSYAWQPQ